MDLDYHFRELAKGLEVNRRALGEDRYEKLTQMAAEIRPMFESDPDSKTGAARKGCHMLQDMIDIVAEVRRRKPPSSA
jgi:hypothetical protein